MDSAKHSKTYSDGELSHLDGEGNWDVCIDTCGYVPRIVKASVEYLKDRVCCQARAVLLLSSAYMSIYPLFSANLRTFLCLHAAHSWTGCCYLHAHALTISLEFPIPSLLTPAVLEKPHSPFPLCAL